MAKTTAPLLSFGASGTVAKTLVASKWKGRPYMRRHVIPANPQSVEQTVTRNTFSVANSIWKVAPALLIAPWDRYAVGQVLTGRNAFVQSFIKTLRGAIDMSTMVFSPGAKGGLAPLTVSAAAGVAGSIDVTITAPAAPDGWTLQAAVAACVANEDPATSVLFNSVAAEDLAGPYVINLAGLTAAQEYVCGGWLRWIKPDTSIAYGASLNDLATPI